MYLSSFNRSIKSRKWKIQQILTKSYKTENSLRSRSGWIKRTHFYFYIFTFILCVILFILSNKIHCCDFADLNIFHFMPFIFGKWLPLTPPPPPLFKPISLQKFPFNSNNTIFWVNQFLILAQYFFPFLSVFFSFLFVWFLSIK